MYACVYTEASEAKRMAIDSNSVNKAAIEMITECASVVWDVSGEGGTSNLELIRVISYISGIADLAARLSNNSEGSRRKEKYES